MEMEMKMEMEKMEMEKRNGYDDDGERVRKKLKRRYEPMMTSRETLSVVKKSGNFIIK